MSIAKRRSRSTDLQKADGDRIAMVLHALGDNPRPSGCRKLSGARRDLYRIRSDPYRVIYEIRDRELIVLVIDIGKRDESTYRGF